MKNINPEKLGYNEWIGCVDTKLAKGDFSPARVIEVNKNSFMGFRRYS